MGNDEELFLFSEFGIADFPVFHEVIVDRRIHKIYRIWEHVGNRPKRGFLRHQKTDQKRSPKIKIPLGIWEKMWTRIQESIQNTKVTNTKIKGGCS